MNILKESLIEYCEELFGMSLIYMQENNIDHNLKGVDEVSILLRNVALIENMIKNTDDENELNEYKIKLYDLNKRLRVKICKS